MPNIQRASGKTRSMSCLLAFLFLIVVPVAFSADDCNDFQPADRIPCNILLPSTVACADISITIYNESNYLEDQQMFQYSPFVCGANFTYTTIGTYNYNYTTGDSGRIVVEEGNKMVTLMFFVFLLIVILVSLGFYMHNNPILVIAGFAMLLTGFFIFQNGFSIYSNLITDMIGTVLIAVGGYFIIMSSMAMIEGDGAD